MPTIFDQRNQTVSGNQYNTARDLNIAHNDSNVDDISVRIQSLSRELNELRQANKIDKIVAVDVEANIKKATLLAEDPKLEKSAVVYSLETARNFLKDVSSAAGLVTSITEVIKVISRVF